VVRPFRFIAVKHEDDLIEVGSDQVGLAETA